ncbi:MAG TPA: hypothetical protein PKD27_02470 [Tepidiformaceae bacterium]|nr:hypothetical protein [Tepidiformaceae bacterium]
MSRRYELARLEATLEQLPELTNRLNLLGERFENMRVASPTEEQRSAAAVFDRLYNDAATMLADAEHQDGGRVSANNLIALEDALRRVEGALSVYSGLVSDPERGHCARAGRDPGGAKIMLGVAILGALYLWARRD